MAKLKGRNEIDITFCIGRKRFDPYSPGGYPYVAQQHWHKTFKHIMASETQEEYDLMKKYFMKNFENYLDNEIDLMKNIKDI